jgi:tetratricopeptide (TPR) repeat protein
MSLPDDPLPAPASGSNSSRRPRRLIVRVARIVGGPLIVLLAGYGGWLVWDHYRPVPTIRDVNRLFAQKRLADAESGSRAALRRNPDDGRMRVLLARILAAQERTTDAAAQLHEVPADSPEKLDALYFEGQAWILTHHARRAEAAWLAYLNHKPEPDGTRTYEGRVETDLINLYSVEDRWDEAQTIIWRSYDRISDPQGKRALTRMAIRSHRERFLPKVALQTLRHYVAADPGDLQAQLAVARMAQAAGIPAEADGALAACREQYADDPSYLKTRFEILAARGESRELEEMLADPPKALESSPTYWRTLGNRAFQKKRWADSAVSYRRVLELDPSDVESTYRLSLIELRLGHRPEAKQLQKRHRELVNAVADFTPAYNGYLDSITDPPPEGSPTVAEAARRLAGLCRVMRWEREADAWKSIADAEAG